MKFSVFAFVSLCLASYAFGTALNDGIAVRPDAVQNPQCSAEALTSAAKCKCALLSSFLPSDDSRINFCNKTFPESVSDLHDHCDRFYDGATKLKGLAAMFKIEKLAGVCFYNIPKKVQSMVRSAERHHMPMDINSNAAHFDLNLPASSSKDVIIIITRRVIIIIIY